MVGGTDGTTNPRRAARTVLAAAAIVTAALIGCDSGRATPPPALSPATVGRTMLLAERVLTRGCRAGVRPDRRCSPGAVSSRLTKRVICSPDFRTGDVRNVPQSLKYEIEREYGMVARAYGSALEIDHIISLELGGSNDIANLFPEPGSGRANYHLKDKLENRLHQMVCAGQMSLRSAQHQIASNWEKLYAKVFGVAP